MKKTRYLWYRVNYNVSCQVQYRDFDLCNLTYRSRMHPTPFASRIHLPARKKKSAYLSKIFVNETHTRTFCVHLELITWMHYLARNFSNLHRIVCCDTWLHSSIPYRLYEFSIIINFTHDFPAGIPITQ